MKTLVSLVVFLSLFIALSCEVPTALEKPLSGPKHSLPGARTTNFTTSDLLYQWRIKWIDKDGYGWHLPSNDACLESLWLYFGQPDVENGDVIEGTWTLTNLTCGEAHTGQQLLDAYFDPYSTAFETWNSIATYPQRYSFNRATGAITLTRNVSLGSGVYKTFQLNLGTYGDMGFISADSPYNDIRIQRESGGPSVP